MKATAADFEDLDPDRIAAIVNAQRRNHRRKLIGVALLGLAVATGTLLYGRANPPTASTATACDGIRSQAGELLAPQAQTPSDNQQRQTDMTMAQNIIIQNPACFDAKTVAAAQTGKDQHNLDAAREALCYATEPGWKC
ncbi:hypothetical protein [Streptomyces violascens]|uniref:hypothetical protein n=1 Tax=Streptomyces violascens TaxID=67381 RepID=UPI0036A08639